MLSFYKPLTIIEPHVEILQFTPNAEQLIELAGRTCYHSEEKITTDSAYRFVKMIKESNHHSVLEHAYATVKIICDRACSHQIVRHRVCSFSQRSQRYVKVVNRAILESPEDWVDAYLTGMTGYEIAKKAQQPVSKVYQELRKLIKLRKPAKRVLLQNANYFDNVDTPLKAYLLGMILADGNVSSDSDFTLVQRRDLIWYLFKIFQTEICINTPLYFKDNSGRINFVSSEFVNGLKNCGIVPNKTYDMTCEDTKCLFKKLPPEYIPDFLRGFLDGDGSVSFDHYTNRANASRQQLRFLGHNHTLDYIKNWLTKTFNYSPKITPVSNCKCLYMIHTCTDEVTEQLCHLMYKNFQYPFGHPIKASKILSRYNINAPVFSKENGFEVILPSTFLQNQCLWRWYESMERSVAEYGRLLFHNIPPEDARSVLPNSTMTEIVMTANLREWRHIFSVRCTKHAQWQIRNIMKSILTEFNKLLPAVFEDQYLSLIQGKE